MVQPPFISLERPCFIDFLPYMITVVCVISVLKGLNSFKWYVEPGHRWSISPGQYLSFFQPESACNGPGILMFLRKFNEWNCSRLNPSHFIYNGVFEHKMCVFSLLQTKPVEGRHIWPQSRWGQTLDMWFLVIPYLSSIVLLFGRVSRRPSMHKETIKLDGWFGATLISQHI